MTTARPILFSAPMVRALLEGRKTQTRRLLKPQPELFYTQSGDLCEVAAHQTEGQSYMRLRLGRVITLQKIPYGAPGDLLWVRETWSHTGTGVWTTTQAQQALDGETIYKADGEPNGVGFWPSIHMPRRFSRLTLEITDVRVERLQDISEGDAIAEGCGPVIPNDLKQHPLAKHVGPNPRNHYAALWESLHGETGPGAWDANPWVVALTFNVHKQNVDAYLGQHAEAA